MKKKKLIIIDGHSQVYKAYYGLRNLSNSKGFPTNAIYGFLLSLKRVLKDIKPDGIAVAFDSKEPSFRANLFKDYKANRQIMPEDLQIQMEYIFKILEYLHITILKKSGIEADDLIGILARYSAKFDYDVYILTADKDLFQLVNDSIKIVNAGKQGEELKIIDRETVKEKLGVYPENVIDYLGLVGDSSDNIPGVPGVGPKTALNLLNDFGNIDSILNNIDKIKNEKLREKIQNNMDLAKLSKQLVTIIDDSEFKIDLNNLDVKETYDPKLIQVYKELEFTSLLKELHLVEDKEDFGEEPDTSKKVNISTKKSISDNIQAPKIHDDRYGLELFDYENVSQSVPNQIEGDYRALFKAEQIKDFVDKALKQEWLSFDTETTGVNPESSNLVGISLSFKEGSAIYIPVGHDSLMLAEPQIEVAQLIEILAPLFLSEKVKKCAQNLKYDLKVLNKAGFVIKNSVFDTMLASYLLNPDRQSHSLKSLSIEFLNLRMTPISDLIGSGKSAITIDKAEFYKVVKYSCADADITLRLTKIFLEKLKKAGLMELMNEIEMPLIEVLFTMENTGIKIDKQYFIKLGEEYRLKLSQLEKEAYKTAGEAFNLNSPKQVADILFNKLKLNPTKTGKTGYSTDVSVLESLNKTHPLVNILLEHRTIEKLRSTYVDSLLQLSNPVTGKIHTSFNQTIASTGRLSSSNPNLQNIPIKTEQGRQIRKGFIPSKHDNILLSADYSQIELRILASISNDKFLTEAFNAGIDIHNLTASKIFGVTINKVTSEMRDRAKVINFGIIYGMTAHRLANDLEISRTIAAKFIDDYFRAYSGVKKWIDEIIVFARNYGYVETLKGRRRYIPLINSKNANLRNAAERVAINMPIQGSSADMIKLAMINIHKRLIKENLKSKMILQVHDELIFDIPVEEKEILSNLVKIEMENALKLNVPVVVDLKFGSNWGEC